MPHLVHNYSERLLHEFCAIEPGPDKPRRIIHA
jgi:hypothetical protein